MERRTYTHGTTAADDVDMVHSDGVVRDGQLERHAKATRGEIVTTRSAYWDSLALRVNSVLFVLLLGLEALLALRFALLAFGANLANDFVDFVMDVSWPFVRPFDGAFANRTWDEGIVEVNTLLAMGVYLLGFVLLALLINALLPHGHSDDSTIRRSRSASGWICVRTIAVSSRADG